MSQGHPCEDMYPEEYFSHGITNGAQWYSVPGKAPKLEDFLWNLKNQSCSRKLCNPNGSSNALWVRAASLNNQVSDMARMLILSCHVRTWHTCDRLCPPDFSLQRFDVTNLLHLLHLVIRIWERHFCDLPGDFWGPSSPPTYLLPSCFFFISCLYIDILRNRCLSFAVF